MKSLRLLLIGCLMISPVFVTRDAFAQFGIPKFPKRGKADSRAQRGKQGADEQSGAAAQGVPVPPDSPIFEAFRRLEGQSVYHQRMKITADDPKMAEMMAQMGFTPPETIVAGDTKQVSVHVSMPVTGKAEDFELRAVLRNGRVAKKWSSPASGRILKEIDANLAKQLADYEAQQATSIARSLAMGPWGLASAGISAAATAPTLPRRGVCESRPMISSNGRAWTEVRRPRNVESRRP